MKSSLFAAVCLVGICAVLGHISVQAVPMDAEMDSLDMRHDRASRLDELPSASTAVMGAAAGDSTFSLCLKGVITPDLGFGGTNCWGWQDTDGKEYAIMGVANGIAFVDAQTMQVKDIITGPSVGCGGTRWREIKTYQKYCYAVSECTGANQGMMIMDMSYLPDSVKFIRSFSTATDIRAHTISIDTVKGYAYLVKQNYSGFRVISLANPTNPVEIGTVATGDLHDMTAHNDTVWTAEANLGTFSVWNMANKTSPQLIDRITIPNHGYVHNIWPTKNGLYLGTTEETASRTVKFWDIQDISNISLIGEYLGGSNLAHNVHMQNDKAFISHYESGISVLSMTDPSNPVELATYDTYTAGQSPNFNGCWGVFPHTASGKVYASNLDGRLFVFLTRSEQLTDTLKVSDAAANPGQKITVDISVTNDVPAKGFVLPINWSGPYNLVLDSISTFGLRTSYFEEFDYLGYDDANFRVAVQIKTSSFGAVPDLPPGSGPVLRAYFTIPSNAAGDSNLVRLYPYVAPTTYSPSIMTDCFALTVPTTDGTVTLSPACCVNLRGNVDASPNDNVDLSDLSVMISYLTSTSAFVTLPCPDEANVNASANGAVDLSDLSLLITYLVGQGGTILPACP